MYGVLPGTWYLAPGSKNSSPRAEAGATPWYLAFRSHHALLYWSGVIEPSNTPQRQRSIISPNGRNDTPLRAMRICALMVASRLSCGLSTRPIEFRYCGVIASTMVSPIASWKPSLAPPWNSGGSGL
ncbi:hypothetical protein D9M71_716640 [compost metagenome]